MRKIESEVSLNVRIHGCTILIEEVKSVKSSLECAFGFPDVNTTK